ncbi:hypothetical protein FNT36_17345 [Hymenobacter setariae]|uniref:Prolipoprotein diacylglyceryl transferase n=1 Tax=Hymenobacter setariae TaxID=2594794 RepID=A0A558BSB1_9BACT|nr:prolipoprotein diacylglyceryl transferase family protein [Hymenobacter setariae]TVT39416.1 hypothetical protein FNT36_17345 [Hymenobacter setariae]
METYLLPTLPTAIGGWPAYALFYLLGFGLAGALLVGHGWRRQYTWQPWLLLVAGTVLAFIAGTRVAAGSGADWHALLTHGHWGTGAPLGRTALGGIAAAVLALAGLRRWLGFGREAADAFALPLMLGLAVQGLGCLLVGCCYGTLLGAGPGLGICYLAGTEPWLAQVAQGALPPTAAVSLPVQAVPVYQIALCLALGAGLLAGRRTLAQRPGLTFALALGLFALGRLGLEYLRAPLGDVMGSGFWHGLKPVQWGLAAAALGLLATARHRLNPAKSAAPLQPVPNRPLPNLLLLLALLVLPPWLLPGQLTVAEALVLRALLLPVLALETWRWVRALRVAGPLPAALLGVGFGLMSQAPAPASRFSEPDKSLTISGGGLVGSNYQLYQDYTTCSTPRADITSFPGYHQRYGGGAPGVAYSQRLGAAHNRRLTVGFNGFLGSTSFDPPAGQLRLGGTRGDSAYLLNGATSRRLRNLNPYVEYTTIGQRAYGKAQQHSYLRLGLGMHLSRERAYDYATEPLLEREVRPGFLIEYGAAHLLWLHVSNYYGTDAVGNGLFRMGLGTSFGHERLTVLGGATIANSNTPNDNWFSIILFGQPSYTAPGGYFLQARWQATPSWLVEGGATSNFNDISQFTLGTRYRLPLGTR